MRIDRREAVLGGKPFGKTGAYERIVGKAFLAVDPSNPSNRIIADIALAPRNAKGLVEFSADLYILVPRDPKAANGTVLFEVCNRGNKLLLPTFNRARSSREPASSRAGSTRWSAGARTRRWWDWDRPPCAI
jgi:hypothetical protein